MEQIELVFLGDTTITGRFKPAILANEEIFSPEIRKELFNADAVIANLEGPLTDTAEMLKCNGLVVGPSGTLKYFVDRGISIFNLANNHIFDNGLSGFEDTIREIKENDCRWFGAGINIDEALKPIVIKKDGIELAIFSLAHNEGLIASKNSCGVLCDKDLKDLRIEVLKFKSRGYIVVLCYHGGEEFTLLPAPSRRRLLRELIDLGGDAVVSNHSHVVQGVDIYKGKYIFNSLGNFVFDIQEYRDVPFVDESMILKLRIKKDKTINFEIVPLKVDFSVPVLNVDNSQEILQRIHDFSDIKNYFINWCKEANRVYFLKRKSFKEGNLDSSLKRKSVLLRGISLIKNLITSRIKRELFFGALIGKLIN